ncbi:hypothetical protein NIES2135_60260 (plasmid) [Leptolyngbya boryana NIES-2135]|jgi:hypothetical protein|uniref:Uncharacterized protein n=1 Tax=Leptolyngbya boryana NIES-2135 TaxID=1973484 RepID=A0A1Z4JR14_LEPBY|nr:MULTISPECIES: hypothetical protein [Leptolyngbya]ULP33348.1 hypothetical protein MCP04_29885 [Leptolyngbya boryana IU 594]BAY59149.1 hypothetical protein NIES2135_60260 [Leptolyngbya boryana NIES-2135]
MLLIANGMNCQKLIPIVLIGLLQACSGSPPVSLQSTPVTNQEAVSQPNPPTSETPTQSIEPVREVQTAERPNLPAFCAPDEYKLFFEKFVLGKDEQGNDIRAMYTADLIEVRNYDNPDQVLEVLRRQDDEFSIDLVDTRWVQLVASPVDNSPYTRLNLNIDRISSDTFQVDYIKAQYKYTGDVTGTESEEIVQTFGNSAAYIFQHRNGCWRLTQKLRSTKPQ